MKITVIELSLPDARNEGYVRGFLKRNPSEIDFGASSLNTRIIMAFKMITGQKIKVKRRIKVIQ